MPWKLEQFTKTRSQLELVLSILNKFQIKITNCVIIDNCDINNNSWITENIVTHLFQNSEEIRDFC